MMDERGTRPEGDAPEGPGDPWRRFDSWSRTLFTLLGLFAAFAFLLVVMPAIDIGIAVGGLVVVSTALAIASLFLVVAAIGRGTSWARPAAVATLWAIVAAGTIGVVADLLVPRLTIPLGAILAIVVLVARPAERPAGVRRDRRIALGLGAAYLAAGILGGVSTVLTSPPAALTASRDDLVLGITTNCEDPGFVPGETDVVVTVAWRWRDRDVLPGIADAFQVEWAPLAPLGQAGLRGAVAGDIVLHPEGPAARLLDAQGALGQVPFVRVGLAGASQAAAEGSLGLAFAWSGAREPLPTDFTVAWAHGGRWTTLAQAACEWPVSAGSEPSTAPG